MFVKNIVKHPFGILIVYIVIVAFGLYSLQGLKSELIPNITMPYVVVITTYPQANPSEVESSVTSVLEESLSSLSGLKKIRSTSNEGNSSIMMEFNWGSNIDSKIYEIREKLDLVKDALPSGANSPMMIRFDPSMIPFLQLSLSGSQNVDELKKTAKNEIKTLLEKVDGVSSVNISGGRERIVRVEVSQNRLEAYNLTLLQVSNALRGQNMDIGGGKIQESSKNFLFRARGKFESIEDIKNAVVTYKPMLSDGIQTLYPVRLSDVADVQDGYDDVQTREYVEDKESVFISIQKQNDQNAVQIANKIYPIIEKLNKKHLSDGSTLTIITDTTKLIKRSISNISGSALSGALYAMIVVFLFLRNIKSSFIIGISIPMSVTITLIFMQMFNISLNLMSLAGLSLGVGMIVDSSVVILENIYQFRERGTGIKTATILGASEMMLSIVASTLTTVCVFIPTIMFKSKLDIVGELFLDLSLTVIISLSSSLVIAMTLVPILSSKFLVINTRRQRPVMFGPLKTIDDFFEKMFTGLENLYSKGIKMVLKARLLTVISLFVILVLSFGVISIVGFVFMPKTEDDSVVVGLELPKGSTVARTEEYTKLVYNDLKTILNKKDYDYIYISNGKGGQYSDSIQTNIANITIALKDFKHRTKSSSDIKKDIKKLFSKYPIAGLTFGTPAGPPTAGNSKPVIISLTSDNNAKLLEMAKSLKDYINLNMKELSDASLNVENGNPEYVLTFNREKMYALGLDVSSVSQEIKANVAGITATKFDNNGNSLDVILYIDSKSKNGIINLESVGVVNSKGNRIPLSSFARFESSTSPSQIIRENKKRVLKIEADLSKHKSEITGKLVSTKLGDAISALSRVIKEKYSFDSEVVVTIGGDNEDLIKYASAGSVLFVLAVLLIYAILVAEFESMLDPFIIFLSMPLMFIGINLFYLITGIPYNIYTLIGAIILAGVVVNNGIVFIDYTRLLVARGYSINDACVLSGQRRLRPILITSLTTILGMLPLALSKAEGSDMIRPIAQAFAGGMMSSTFTTLFFIPCVYSLFHNAYAKLRKRINEKESLREQKIEEFYKNNK